MAQTVHLRLEIDGNPVEGESTVSSMNREGTIECLSYEAALVTPRDEASGRVRGRRQHQPITFVKRIDKSTPLLIRALCQNQPINKAEFHFFRPSPGGSGAEEHFYTVLLEDAYVSSVRQLSEDATLAGQDAAPMIEEIELVFSEISWTYEIGGATHKDSWRGE